MATLAPEPVETFPVDPLDVSRAELYRDDVWQAPFRRLRSQAPVYRCEHSDYGPYWSAAAPPSCSIRSNGTSGSTGSTPSRSS